MEMEIVKMSSKGQLVVPQDIRKVEEFKPGDRFISFPLKEGVAFKRIETPDLLTELDKLAKDFKTHLKNRNISSKDLKEAVKWARKG